MSAQSHQNTLDAIKEVRQQLGEQLETPSRSWGCSWEMHGLFEALRSYVAEESSTTEGKLDQIRGMLTTVTKQAPAAPTVLAAPAAPALDAARAAAAAATAAAAPAAAAAPPAPAPAAAATASAEVALQPAAPDAPAPEHTKQDARGEKTEGRGETPLGSKGEGGARGAASHPAVGGSVGGNPLTSHDRQPDRSAAGSAVGLTG